MGGMKTAFVFDLFSLRRWHTCSKPYQGPKGTNNPDQPHLGPPPTPWAQEVQPLDPPQSPSRQCWRSIGLLLGHGHTCIFIWSSARSLASWLGLSPLQLLWTCLVFPGPEPNPDPWLVFPAWPQTCLNAVTPSYDPHSWLDLAAASGSILLGCAGAGPCHAILLLSDTTRGASGRI